MVSVSRRAGPPHFGQVVFTNSGVDARGDSPSPVSFGLAAAAPANPCPARAPSRPSSNRQPESACPNSAAAKFPNLLGGRWSLLAQILFVPRTPPFSQSLPHSPSRCTARNLRSLHTG